MGSFCPAPASHRGGFSPPWQLQLCSQAWRSRRGGAADKEALRLPDKAARHLWGSGRRRWHGQAGRGDPPGTERCEAQGQRPQPRRAPQTVLCSSASASRWGSYLPPAGAAGEAGAAPGAADVCPACRCCRGTGERDTGAPWSLTGLPPGARGSQPCSLLRCQESGGTTEAISVTEGLRLHLPRGSRSCPSRQGPRLRAVTWDPASGGIPRGKHRGPASAHSPPAAARRAVRVRPGASWGQPAPAAAARGWRAPFPPPPP